MNANNPKSIILMLIEGWGLSPKWSGNAIVAANPTFFQHFWRTYYHLALNTKNNRNMPLSQNREDPFANYYSIATGKTMPNFHAFILEEISAKNMNSSSLFNNSKSHNSAVHLIGSLSKNAEYGDLKIVEEIIRQAKERKIFRLYVHILADNTFADKKSYCERISELEQILSHYDLGEIATICGLSSLKSDELLRQYFNLLLKGIGERYIDTSQAVNRQSKAPELLKPSVLIDNPDALIKDFDTAIFFNHQLDSSKVVINQLIESDSRNIREKPNFIKIFTLVNFPTIFSEKINSLFQINKGKSLAAELKESASSSFFISEAKKSAQFNFYFDANNFTKSAFIQEDSDRNYLSQWRGIITATNTRIVEAITKSQYKLIVGNYSILPHLCQDGGFKDIVHGVTELDNSIAKIAEATLKNNGVLIIASPYGLAEQIDLEYKKSGTISARSTNNPVPLIVVADNSQISDHKNTNPKESINELVSPKKDLTTIHHLLLLLCKESLDL